MSDREMKVHIEDLPSRKRVEVNGEDWTEKYAIEDVQTVTDAGRTKVIMTFIPDEVDLESRRARRTPVVMKDSQSEEASRA